ncbi:MAG: preprotein translocase subunit YajC [Myxococcales bacterium]|nr:preprotein translocase subunit YajC [Myxococcales bacterium]
MAMIALMFAVFYFLLIRPQQKRQKAQEAMLSALAKGVVVRTTGGIRGEITQIDEREVTLLVADRTRINVLRSAIAGPEAAASVQDEKNEKNEKK